MKSMMLSGNNLKIIAAIAMVFDHVGILFFPDIAFFRIIGRIAFPIFAFFIAEGCKYTHDRVRYLAMIAGMALLFQIVYFVVEKSLYMSVFVTFTLSILLIYLLDHCKKVLLEENTKLWRKTVGVAAFFIAIFLVYLLTEIEYKDFAIDYGFWGCMTPVFAALFHVPKNSSLPVWKKLDKPRFGALAMLVPLIGISLVYYKIAPLQFYCLLAIPLLLLYSGKRGKYKMKYFFYIFYPVHLVVLYAIFYLQHYL